MKKVTKLKDGMKVWIPFEVSELTVEAMSSCRTER